VVVVKSIDIKNPNVPKKRLPMEDCLISGLIAISNMVSSPAKKEKLLSERDSHSLKTFVDGIADANYNATSGEKRASQVRNDQRGALDQYAPLIGKIIADKKLCNMSLNAHWKTRPAGMGANSTIRDLFMAIACLPPAEKKGPVPSAERS
jgi:hypothetical protein